MEFKLLLDQALLKRAHGVVYIFPPTLPFLHVTLFMCCSYIFICLLAFLACYCGQQEIAQIWQGYDVAAIACPERYVVGLDISDIAIKKAVEVRAVGQKILTSLRLAIS